MNNFSDEKILLNLIEKYEKLEQEINITNDYKIIGSIKKSMGKKKSLYDLSKKYFNLKDEVILLNSLSEEERSIFSGELEKTKEKMEEIFLQVKDEIIKEQENKLDQNIFLEIRAGTGGDEASLFAGELLNMYERYGSKQGLKMEILERSYNSVNGIKSITTAIRGPWAWKYFQFESGTHRVQRVPVTEKSGRLHTSTVTVAILPEEDENENFTLNMKEVQVEYSTSQGAGGQHVNKTESAVIMIHIPTGIKVKIQDERSQHKNRDKAESVLTLRVREHYRIQKEAETSAARNSQLGTGERSEKIRTYNFPQNRLTHHSFNINLYNLSIIMTGEMLELFNQMLLASRTKLEEKAGIENE